MPTSFQVTFDCADPGRLARFWAEALGYEPEPPPAGFDSWEAWAVEQGIPPESWNDTSAIVDPAGERPRILFQRVPEPKTVKNRLHLDVNVGGPRDTPTPERRPRVDAEVTRLEGLGASRLRAVEEYGEYWIVMADPEGNEFCLQ